MIFADTLVRVADEAHAARVEVVQPAEIVRDLERFRVRVERVDREIAPCGILAPIACESDRRAATIGGDVVAQSGHFHRATIEQRGNRAVIDPGRDGPDPRRLASFDHLFGP